MQVELAEERVFLLKDRFSMELAEGRAWTKRIEAFGTMAKVAGLLARPRDEEFEVVYRERRLQPFWRLAVSAVCAYERARDFPVKVNPEVQSVTLLGQAFGVANQQFTVRGLESCREETRREALIDGLTKTANPALGTYLQYESVQIDAAALAAVTAEGTVVVPPEARASLVVRDVVASAIGKIDADKVLEEVVRVEAVDLFYRPVYAFRYRRAGKEAIVEFDALTGEVHTGGVTFEEHFGKVLDPSFLLDVGAETLNFVLPGANLAKMVLVKGMQMRKGEG
jgi:hypothetical protein